MSNIMKEKEEWFERTIDQLKSDFREKEDSYESRIDNSLGEKFAK